MKLSLRLIAVLVILSLTATFAYQAYWLVNLYQTLKADAERNIVEAMRISDYQEVMGRAEWWAVNGDRHGTLEVSAARMKEESQSMVFTSQTESHYVKGELTITTDSASTGKDSTRISANVEKRNIQPSVDDGLSDSDDFNDKFQSALAGKSDLLDLAVVLQKGIHIGIDQLCPTNYHVYDSLLNMQLQEAGVHQPYRLEVVRRDSSMNVCDTILVSCDSAFHTTADTRNYDYSFDTDGHVTYRLWIGPVTSIVLGQMGGILATSLVFVVVLGLSFWYMIHVILRQKSLDEMKTDFTNNMTHELKTPIAVAYAANDVLLNFKKDSDEDVRRKYLKVCQEQLNKLSALVEQILSMSMERRKNFRLSRERTDMGELLDEVVRTFRLKADKNAVIDLRLESEGIFASVDRVHIANAVGNLIDNSLKYSGDRAEVRVRCWQTGNGSVVISVSDNGIGISQDKLQYVFDKFYRVPTGNRHEVKGYGLGLHYVKTIVGLHGGTVTAHSRLGKGSTFYMEINGKEDKIT